jgi:hypothetical protein
VRSHMMTLWRSEYGIVGHVVESFLVAFSGVLAWVADHLGQKLVGTVAVDLGKKGLSALLWQWHYCSHYD